VEKCRTPLYRKGGSWNFGLIGVNLKQRAELKKKKGGGEERETGVKGRGQKFVKLREIGSWRGVCHYLHGEVLRGRGDRSGEAIRFHGLL